MTSSFDHRPRIACIIAYYNGSCFIKRSLSSALKQTVPFYEIIIVNDGSQEDERAAISELESDQVKILDKVNGGQGSARNTGVAASDSELICFLDQDDYYLDNHNETLLREFIPNNPHLGFVYADLWEGEENGDIIRYNMIKDHAIHPKTTLQQCLSEDMMILPSASMIKKEAFESVGGFDEQFKGYEDDDLFLRLFRKGWAHRFIDKPVTVWCINEKSTSYSLKMDESRLKYVKKLCSIYLDDAATNRYWTRDLIYPRFKDTFIRRAVYSYHSRHDDRSRLLGILIEFNNVIKEASNQVDTLEIEQHIANMSTDLKPVVGECDPSSCCQVHPPGPSQAIATPALPYKNTIIRGKEVRIVDIEKLHRMRGIYS